MDANSKFSVNHAFVLEPEQARKICKLLGDRIGSLTIGAQCADDMVREFTDIKRLLAYENPSNRRILSLVFSSQADDFNKRAQIEFDYNSWHTISVSIHGTEAVVSRLRDDLREIVNGVKPWYWRFARIDFFTLSFFYIAVGCLIAMIYFENFHDKSEKLSDFPIRTQLVVIAVLFVVSTVIVVGSAASIWGLNRLRDRYFPLAVFAIGQEAKRYHTNETIRWTIVVGFLVSLAASIVAATIGF